MNAAETARCMALLTASYPRQPVNGETGAVYGQLLADLEFEDVQRAILEHVATSQYFPAVAEIRKLAARRQLALPEAEEAWAEVLNAVRWCGRYRTPTWSSPVVADAVAAIGWGAICDSETIGVERAHFLRAFAGLRERALTAANVGPLLKAHDERQAARLGKSAPAGKLLKAVTGDET